MTTPDTFSGLFLGYAVIWAILCLYLLLLGRRVRRLEMSADNNP